MKEITIDLRDKLLDERFWRYMSGIKHYRCHMNYMSPYEMDDNCGTCDGARCSYDNKGQYPIVEIEPSWHLTYSENSLIDAVSDMPEIVQLAVQEIIYNDRYSLESGVVINDTKVTFITPSYDLDEEWSESERSFFNKISEEDTVLIKHLLEVAPYKRNDGKVIIDSWAAQEEYGYNSDEAHHAANQISMYNEKILGEENDD